MAVCYLNASYDKKYKCNYEIKESIIEVEVEYPIFDEIEPQNGMRFFGPETEFKTRDILICDYANKRNYLLKDAFYAGFSNVYGNPDDGSHTKFQTHIFFEHEDFYQLCKLPETPKIKKIRISSETLNNLIGYSKIKQIKTDDEYIIKLPKSKIEEVCIDHNNIRKIKTMGGWNSLFPNKHHNINIEFNGYIELELAKRANYDSIHEFINELIIFMQLYYPDKFVIDDIYVMVDDNYYKLFTYRMRTKYRERHVKKTVNEELLKFLSKCYTSIPYRNSKQDIRNIPYIVMNTNRSIEDIFLTRYRFIECYYKKQQIPNIRKTFMTYSITEHYAVKHSLAEGQIENYAQEIICLRNHFVHSGYYIKNSSLKISFDRLNRKKNPKDYTVTNIDFNWIYERAKILYEIALDIIFSKMLGYKEYEFMEYF